MQQLSLVKKKWREMRVMWMGKTHHATERNSVYLETGYCHFHKCTKVERKEANAPSTSRGGFSNASLQSQHTVAEKPNIVRQLG